jgi:hypothetical protein
VLNYGWLLRRASVGRETAMPGHFGNSETDEDGCYAETQSSAHVGFFGNNTSSDPSAGGGAGGAGVFGLTVSPNAAGVFGANNGPSGAGVQGNGATAGVSGFSDQGNALRGFSNGGDALYAATQSSAHSAVFGNNQATAAAAGGAGGAGVFGLTVSPNAAGVLGANNGVSGAGVQGNGPTAGVSGFSEQGFGVLGHSNHNDGAQLFAHDAAHNGVLGLNDATGQAPAGGSPVGNGVYGYTDVPNASGVVGAVAANNAGGAGVTGIGPVAGRFFGDVIVTGDVQLTGADLAEEFGVVGEHQADPGSVVVLAGDDQVRVSDQPYDHRVAGVVSGAGSYRPALVLDRRSTAGRHPLALSGKVWCKVDAGFGAIRVGDLLTTSSVPGHAMRASDRELSFGAVIGKALAALDRGRGLVPILVALQ